MVRLKAKERLGRKPKNQVFQFHNGSIKSMSYPVVVFEEFAFQFHNGSIKSLLMDDAPLTILEFQFHNGSIKSRLHTDSEAC